MTITTIETPYNRTLTVDHNDAGTFLKAAKTEWDTKEIQTYLQPEQVTELAEALLGENATVITDLPEAHLDRWGDVKTGVGYSYNVTANVDDLLEHAKALLSAHAFLVKRNEEQEAAKVAEEAAVKAKEAAKAKRRDELTKELTGNNHTEYQFATPLSQKAIDRIIELEAAQA